MQRRGPGPRALYRDIFEMVLDELADARRAVDMRDNLEQKIWSREALTCAKSASPCL